MYQMTRGENVGHGGKREGSGRKKLGKVAVCVRLFPEAVAALKSLQQKHKLSLSETVGSLIDSQKD
jgi:hypothetical protein